ncbi:hypothetical protein EJB05_40808, partial [Eragrostis curvula]
MDWSHVRSLTLFGERPIEHAPPLCSPQLMMLRALDLEHADFKVTQKELNNIGLLRHLKYMTIRHARGSSPYIYELPRSIEKLQGLQVLDMGYNSISTLPTEICKLQSLRIIRCTSNRYYNYFDSSEPMKFFKHSLCLPIIFTPLVDFEERNLKIAELHMGYSKCWSKTTGVKVPIGIGKLKELHTLEMVDLKRTSGKAIGELGELSKLRKLSKEQPRKKCMTLRKAIEKLSSLGSLRIEAASSCGTVEWLDSVSSPSPAEVSQLGGIKVDWFRNLTQLVKLRPYLSELEEGKAGVKKKKKKKKEEGKAVEILGALPNLMLLHFSWRRLLGRN